MPISEELRKIKDDVKNGIKEPEELEISLTIGGDSDDEMESNPKEQRHGDGVQKSLKSTEQAGGHRQVD